MYRFVYVYQRRLLLLLCLSIDPSKLLYTLLHLFCLCFFIIFLFFILFKLFKYGPAIPHVFLVSCWFFLLRVYDNVPFRSAVCVPLCYKTIVCNRKQNLLTLTTNNGTKLLIQRFTESSYYIYIANIANYHTVYSFHISYIIIFDFLIQLQCCLSYSLNDILVFFFV